MIMVVVIWFNHNILDTPYLGYIREVHAMIMVVVIWFNHNVLDTPLSCLGSLSGTTS